MKKIILPTLLASLVLFPACGKKTASSTGGASSTTTVQNPTYPGGGWNSNFTQTCTMLGGQVLTVGSAVVCKYTAYNQSGPTYIGYQLGSSFWMPMGVDVYTGDVVTVSKSGSVSIAYAGNSIALPADTYTFTATNYGALYAGGVSGSINFSIRNIRIVRCQDASGRTYSCP